MTQEEKDLVVKDLCARLPYRTFVQTYHYNTGSFEPLMPRLLEAFIKDEGLEIKPYLRSMSSMTEEESKEFALLQTDFYVDGFLYPIVAINMVNWLNEHHFDYHGLIEKGLALEASEGIYNDKEERELTDSGEECQAFKDAKAKT